MCPLATTARAWEGISDYRRTMSPAFLIQRPRLIWKPGGPSPLVKTELRPKWPELAEDFTTLDEVLVPVYDKLDADARRAQNSFRRGQVMIIGGGSVATALGAVQAALGGGSLVIGILGALVAGFLGTVTTIVRGQDAQTQYLTTRLKAERLRGEYFLFLGRLAPYDAQDQAQRRRALRDKVDAIDEERPA
jgi:hypothetical protein